MRFAVLLCAVGLLALGCSPRHGVVAFPSDDGPRLPASAPANVRVVPAGVAPRAGCRPLGWVAAGVGISTVFGHDDAVARLQEAAASLGANELHHVRVEKSDNHSVAGNGLAVACSAPSL